MKHRLFTILAVLSLLICLSLSTLWARSYFSQDVIAWTRYGDGLFRLNSLISGQGKLLIAFQIGIPISTPSDPDAADRSRSIINAQKPNNLAWNINRSRDPIAHIPGRSLFGFRYVRITYPETGLALAGQHIILRRDLTAFSVPLWPLVLLSVLLPIRWLFILRNQWRRKKRLRLGLCTTCGYDLRASTEKCPECGSPIPATLHS